MGLYEAGSAIILEDEAHSFFPINNLRVSDNLVNNNHVDISPSQSNTLVPSTADEDYDFSDVVLKCINQMLMEEDIEETSCMFQQSAALRAAERSFYEVIGEEYPPPPSLEKPSNLDQNGYNSMDHSGFHNSGNDGCDGVLCPNWNLDLGGNDVTHVPHFLDGVALRSTSWSPHSSSNTVPDVLVDSPVSTLRIPDIFCDSESIMQFKKGVEEASKFIPTGNSLFADVRYNVVGNEQNEEKKDAVVKVEKYGEKQSPERSRGKKNTLQEDVVDLTEERNSKHSAVFSESTV
uniref:Scarecrow-like protein 14 n=1 Tax=Nicotiana sylvestris TaxID=4096 RepID=A0A1U7YAR7_NICSY|nr:PREDICTED: scarecrow-like protein 14 [Nicotiana sylvestris]